MIRFPWFLSVLAISCLVVSSASAGFIMDPNYGSYSSSDTPPRPLPESLEEKRAADKEGSDLREALADYGRFFRFNRYVFIGVGGKQGTVEQGGNTGSQGSGFAGTVGFDLDGLQWLTPFILEARGNFGFGPPTGETALFWYLGGPVSRALWDKEFDIKNPLNDDLKAGIPFGTSVLRNGGAIPEWAAQFLPVKFELGVGYQGVSFEQVGGTVVDGGTKVRSTTTGMIAGLAFAARVGYFGERDMLRLTGYYLKSSQSKTGGKFVDGFFGGEMEMSTTVKGRMLEGKLDFYHRMDERVRQGSWITGYGLSLIGRQIHLDEGQTIQWRGSGNVTSVFPAQDATQIEILATIGYMR